MPGRYKIFWASSALNQLDEIYDFIAEISPVIAKRVTQGLEKKAKSLKNSPFIGQEETLLKEFGFQHRYLVYSNYKIIYLVVEYSIYIVAIIDTRSDPEFLVKKVL